MAATITEIHNIVANCTGFPADDVIAIGQALADSFDEHAHASDDTEFPTAYIARLMLALHANAKPENAAAVAEEYYQLANGTIPDSIPTAGAMIECFLRAHYSGEKNAEARLAYHSSFECCHATSGIRLTTATESGPQYVAFLGNNVAGTLLAFSQFREGARRSYTIEGKNLYHIALDVKALGTIQRSQGPITNVDGIAL